MIIYTTEDGKGNVVEQLVSNGDGTGVLTVWDDGNVISSEQCPINVVETPVVSAEERVAILEAQVEALITILDGGT